VFTSTIRQRYSPQQAWRSRKSRAVVVLGRHINILTTYHHKRLKQQSHNPGVTEIVKMPNRGHSLTIDHGWREVAQTALDFVKRFA